MDEEGDQPLQRSVAPDMLVAKSLRGPLLRTPKSTLRISQKQDPLFWKSARPPVGTLHRHLTPSVSKKEHLTPSPSSYSKPAIPRLQSSPVCSAQVRHLEATGLHLILPSPVTRQPLHPLNLPSLCLHWAPITLSRSPRPHQDLSLLCLPALSSFSLTGSFSYSRRWLSIQNLTQVPRAIRLLYPMGSHCPGPQGLHMGCQARSAVSGMLPYSLQGRHLVIC